ncbi:MAG: hypothetical protein IPM74_03930 [Crocinitomicaceae bacterium]|nr:hypothetical protein [Crocinitomicaceae bacterium]MBK8925062.1 hypothetical protein [Crocinitomicaceae bacterium]
MSFAGFVSNMINTMQRNRNDLKAGKRKPFEQEKGKTKHEKWVDPVQLSPEEYATLRQDIQTKARSEKKRELLITLIALGIGLLCFGWLFLRYI